MSANVSRKVFLTFPEESRSSNYMIRQVHERNWNTGVTARVHSPQVTYFYLPGNRFEYKKEQMIQAIKQ